MLAWVMTVDVWCLPLDSLSGTYIGPSGAIVLAGGLATNCTIQQLQLARVSVGGVGVAALARSVTGHPALRSLDLSWNVGDVDEGWAKRDRLEELEAAQAKELARRMRKERERDERKAARAKRKTKSESPVRPVLRRWCAPVLLVTAAVAAIHYHAWVCAGVPLSLWRTDAKQQIQGQVQRQEGRQIVRCKEPDCKGRREVPQGWQGRQRHWQRRGQSQRQWRNQSQGRRRCHVTEQGRRLDRPQRDVKGRQTVPVGGRKAERGRRRRSGGGGHTRQWRRCR